jgi:hypothetical protein
MLKRVATATVDGRDVHPEDDPHCDQQEIGIFSEKACGDN